MLEFICKNGKTTGQRDDGFLQAILCDWIHPYDRRGARHPEIFGGVRDYQNLDIGPAQFQTRPARPAQVF
jgi:hypothetical protein